MANVTVEVVGKGASGSENQSSQQNSFMPSNDRMVENIRHEIQSRGVLFVPGTNNVTQLINQYGQNLKEDVNSRITEKYDIQRENVENKFIQKKADIDIQMAEERKRLLATYSDADNPDVQNEVNARIDKKRQYEYKKANKQKDIENEAIFAEETAAKKTSEDELTKTLKELLLFFKEEIKRTGGIDENSYIGKLRSQQRELILKREKAGSEDEAISYSRELSKINSKIRDTLSGEKGGSGSRVQDPVIQATRGIQQALGGAENGDISNTIMGVGTAGVALSGVGISTAMKILGWVGVAAGVGKKLSESAKDYESMSHLASLRSPSMGFFGKDSMHYLNANLLDMDYNGVNFRDYNLSRAEFAAEAAQRSRIRGTGNDFYSETIRQIGLEKSLALNSGALGQAGIYDRYGIKSTDAISRLVTMLDSITRNGIKSGVDYTDFTRVQEKFDIQQQVISSYLNRSDKPSYDIANRAVAGFSAIKGITQDSRLGSDYAQFQNAIQNPSNDRMRALIYGAVSDIIPGVSGRMDLVDRAIRDPQNEGKIMQAVVQRLTSQFGGTDTQMGYFVMKKLFPNIAPERLDEYIKQLSNPNALASKILTQGMNVKDKQIADENAITWTKQSKDFITGYSVLLNDISEYLKQIAGWCTGTTWSPKTPPPRKGH